MANEPSPERKKRLITIWDLPTRLFHWLFAAAIAAAILSAENDALEIHAICGYAVLGLVLFRVLWGFVGSTPSRFSAFVRGPRAVVDYGLRLFSRSYEFHATHNPLGGWVVVAMLGAAFVQATMGLFATDDVLFEGPLGHLISTSVQNAITEAHHFLGHVILYLIVLHIGAVLFYRIVKGTNLVIPMITGRTAVPGKTPLPVVRQSSTWFAAAIAVAAAYVVYALIS